MPVSGLYNPPALSGTLSPFSILPGRQYQLGNITLNNVDSQGVEWRTTGDIVGWWDSPDITGVVTQKNLSHGSWSGPAFYPSRVITLNLYVRAPSVDALDQALTTLSAQVATTEVTAFVAPGNPATFCYCRRSGPITATRKGAWAYVTVILYASDPRRYVYSAAPIPGSLGGSEPGLSLPITLPATLPGWTPGGTVSGPLVGNLPAPWQAQINGYVVNPTLTNQATGDYVALNLTINDGDYVVVDSLQGTVLYNGVTDYSGSIVPGSRLFTLDPSLGSWSVTYTGGTAPGHNNSSVLFLARDCIV